MEFYIEFFSQSVHPCKCVMAWWLWFTVYMCSSEMWITESWVKYVDHWTLFLVEPRCLLRTVLVPWCLMLPVRAWLLGWLVLRQSSAWWQVSMWVQMFFLLFLQSKTVLKKMGLSSLSYQYLPKPGDTFVWVQWEAWKWAIALKTSGFPQLMTCSRTPSSNKGTRPLRTMRKSPSQFPDILLLPDICLLFIQILFCFSHSADTTSLWVTVLLLLF